MAVATGVVGRPLVSARVAAIEVPAEGRRAADLDRAHDLQDTGRQAAVPAKGFTVFAEDVGDFRTRPRVSPGARRVRVHARHVGLPTEGDTEGGRTPALAVNRPLSML